MNMELPKIDVPIYELTLPSDGKEIKVRPFLVKEEKLLLIASESKEPESIIRTTLQVISNCIVDSDVNVNSLPFFDIDYLFIALRAKSLGESIQLNFKCNNVVNSELCGNVFPVNIDISNVEVFDLEKPKVVQLTNTTSLRMKFPTYSLMRMLDEKDNVLEKKTKIMTACIDAIVEKTNVMSAKDFSREQLSSFIDGLTEEQLKKIQVFTDKMPSFAIKANQKCKKCGFDHSISYTDFITFFM
jgi:hypothetical protein